MAETRTVKDWLTELASSDTSTELDDAKMAHLLHKMDFHNAKVVCGIVYLEGRGTLNAPPMSIQSMAKMIIQ